MTTREIPNTFDLQPGEWIMHCPACGFAHEKMTAARPVCDNCRHHLEIARQPSIAETRMLLSELSREQRGKVFCVSEEYLEALAKIRKPDMDRYLEAFKQPPKTA